jgi:hypothetical protein
MIMQRNLFIVSRPFDFFPSTSVGASSIQPIEQLKKDYNYYGLLLPMASFIGSHITDDSALDWTVELLHAKDGSE